MSEVLLSVEDLRVSFATDDGVVHAVDGISYEVYPARRLGSSASQGPARAFHR